MEKDTIVFTNGNLFSLLILSDFIFNHQTRVSKIVIINGDYKGRKGWSAFFNYLKTTSIFYVVYKILTLVLKSFYRFWFGLKITSVEDLANGLNIDCETVHDINNMQLFSKIERLNPTYLLSVSCPQLIKKKWLELFNYRGINIHSSMLPSYAGLAPYFWVLSQGENATGVSVHYLAKGFDKGNILVQEKLSISERDSCFNLFTNQCILGKRLLIEAFKKMELGVIGEKQNFENYSYFSHPSTKAYLKILKRNHSLFRLSDLKKARTELTKIQKRLHH